MPAPTRSRTVITVTAAALTVLSTLAGLSPTSAAFAESREETTKELKAEFRESSRAASAAYERSQALQAQAKTAAASARSARAELAKVAAQERGAIAAAGRARDSAAQAQARVDGTQAALIDAQADLGDVARTLYMRGPMNTATLVLNAEDLTQMSREIELNRWAGDWQERRIIAFDRARLAQADAARALLARKEQAESAEKQAKALADLARRTESAASRASRSATRLSAQAQATLRDARRAARADEAKYKAFEAQTKQLKTALRNGSTRPTGPSSNGLILPVPGGVSSPYGMRSHPVTGAYKLHTGVDLSAGCGTPVVAAANGRVLSAGFDNAYGNRIEIRHGLIKGKDVTTTYNHQSRLNVRAGQQVQQGQVIGWVGTTGLSTGCHMHFEVLVNGSFVDPMSF
jgi:murein DD-endopeptidase MepM/ murein hydrolase activator NlpD